MVKKKRLPNPTSSVDTCQQNGMILEGVSHSKESIKKCYNNVSDINLCQNTRSKQKQPVDCSGVSSAELNGYEEARAVTATTRTSHRAPKPSARTRKTESPRCSSIPDQVKTRRSWELWSVDDKNTFFEALSEYGKDFESIQHYICQKNKKKNHPPHMIKNKDQVRHFYYRTWHKISKYLDIGDDVKKQTQELYGLINYGELRKKIGGRLDEKSSQKLNELILKGATTVRLKGKNLRVKTPVCRALKKLIHIDDPKEEHLKFPHMITLEFQPQTNAAWTHVQSIAHNPRLRMTVSLQRRLSTILNFLQTRWKSHRVKQKQNVSCTELVSRQENDKVLRVFPKKDATITLVSMQTSSENVTNMHVCLQNYRENVLQKNVVDCSADCRKVLNKQLYMKNDPKNEDEKLVSVDCNAAEETCMNETAASDQESEKLKGNKESETEASLEIMLGKNLSEQEKPVSDSDVNSIALFHGNLINESKNSQERFQTIRRGWNYTEAEALTVGEIYVMLGNPSKIILEYCWENEVDSKPLDSVTAKSPAFQMHSFVLNKLMSAASTTLSDLSKMKQEKQFSSTGGNPCHCGHSCSPGVPAFKLPLLAGSSTAALRNGSKMQKNLISKLVKDNAVSDSTADSTINRGQQEGVQAAPFKNSFPSLQQKKLTTSEAAFKEQLDRFLPANKKARGNIRKSVVVQRELPLLPKTLPSHSMMTLRIVPTASQLAGSFVPVISNPNLSPGMSTYSKIVKLPTAKATIPTTIVKTAHTGEKMTAIITSMAADAVSNIGVNSSSPLSSAKPSAMDKNTVTVKAMNLPTEIHPLVSKCRESSKEESFLRSEETTTSTATNKTAESLSQVDVSSPPSTLRTSPPNISSMFDISIPGSETQEGFQMENISVSLGNSTKLLDISSNNSNSTFLDVPTTASGLSNSSLYKGSTALENVWLNGENEDLSLSSLLGNLESPMKQSSSGISVSTFQEGGGATSDSVARLSADVDNHFHTLLNESSLDYISKFADLAAQIAETSHTSGK